MRSEKEINVLQVDFRTRTSVGLGTVGRPALAIRSSSAVGTKKKQAVPDRSMSQINCRGLTRSSKSGFHLPMRVRYRRLTNNIVP